MAFEKKRLRVQFSLAQGVFSGGGNAATIENLRMTFVGYYPGGADQGTAEVSIWGLPLSMMNQLSTVGTQINQISKNQISVFAGEDGGAMSLVYSGSITSAFVDANAQPDVAFRIIAAPGTYQAVKPAKPISIKGSADVAGMMQGLASDMGMTFENAGVNVKLSNPYYGGTPWTQALAIAKAANIDVTFDRGTMAIVAPNKAREGDMPLFSKDTGMVGYPAFNQASVLINSIYNPTVKHYGLIEVKSDLTPANGKWKVNNLTLDLASQMPKGKWFMLMECVIADSGTP